MALAASAGACDRCTWRLDAVEIAGATDGPTTQGSTGAENTGEADSGVLATDGPTTDGSATDGSHDVGGPGVTSTGSGDGGAASSGAMQDASGPETAGADDTGVPGPYCGDNHVDPGEKCDDGNIDDDDGCPSGQGKCEVATCGDGFVYAGMEDCEDGNKEDYDGCNNSCWAPRAVFVTAKGYTGNLGGVEGANKICGATASAVKLPGEFKAWLSTQDPQSAPEYRFESVNFAGWYVFAKGPNFVRGWEALTDEIGLGPVFWTDENGMPPFFPSNKVWTNTTVVGGANFGPDCSSWNDDVIGSGKAGRIFPEDGDDWTDYESISCQKQAHLYCFQVGPSPF